VARPQPGIFAQGTRSHYHLEFDLRDGATDEEICAVLGGLREPSVTAGGSNIVVGFGPALWRRLRPGDAPPELADFEPIEGDGRRAPATQHDLWVWSHGTGEDVELDVARAVVVALEPAFELAAEQPCFVYKDSRDLTGFIDGTENPGLLEAPEVVAGPTGASVVLHQLWRHDTAAWEGIGDAAQERAMGRTKPDSVEFGADVMPAEAHVARTKIEVDGTERPIFRRNVAYGGVTDHGTVFVGFAADQWRLAEMLRRMAGLAGGPRDALTRYTTPLTGAYYVVPTVEALRRFAPPDDD
jgi:putative iron-dependent peroxidase